MTLATEMTRRASLGTLLGAAASLSLVSPAALAQKSWPSKPLRWIIPYPAGGGQDFLARVLSVQMGSSWASPS